MTHIAHSSCPAWTPDLRILIVNQCFHPDVAATAQHAWDLARHLTARGHTVTAITSRSLYGESGSVLPSREEVEGIRIIRVGSSRFGKRSLFGRAVDFAGFFFWALVAAVRLPRQDLSICLTTPPFVSVIGLLLRLMRGGRCITWLMDLYPDVLDSSGLMRRDTLAFRLLDRLSRAVLCGSDSVVVLGRCMADRARAKGVHDDAIVRIPPWSGEAEGAPPLKGDARANPYRERWSSHDRVVFMYSGNFGIGHDLESIGSGIRRLCERPGSQFALVGGGKRKAPMVESLAEQAARGAVVVEPYQPREAVGDLLRAADVHFVSLGAGWEGVMVPSKFFGILEAGRAVIYVGGGSSEVARVIQETGCGVVVEPGQVDRLVQVMSELRDRPDLRRDLGDRAREAATTRYSRQAALERWAELIERVGAA